MSLRSKQDSLSFKMGLGFGIVGLILIGGLLITILQMNGILTQVNKINKNYLPISDTIFKFSDKVETLVQTELDIPDTTTKLPDTTFAKIDSWQQDSSPLLEELTQYANNYNLKDYSDNINQIREKNIQVNAFHNQYLALMIQGQKDPAKQLIKNKIIPLTDDLKSHLEQLLLLRQNLVSSSLTEMQRQVNNLLVSDWAFLIAGVILCSLLGIILTKSLTKPIGELVEIAQNLAKGNLDQEVNVKGALEFERLSGSLNNMVKAFQDLAGITEKISEGDYSSRVTIRSNEDKLAISVNQMLENFTQTVNQANAIAAGNYNIEIIPRSENDKLGVALKNMTLTLQQNKKNNQEENWIKDGVALISNTISGTHDLTQLCEHAISAITRYIEGAVGVVYIYTKDTEELQLFGSYAYVERDALSNRFKLGEGIIGQTALERKPILLKNIPHNEKTISTGTLEVIPVNILSLPIIHEQELMGVIEIASHLAFNEQSMLYINAILPLLGIQMKAAQQQTLTKKLLADAKLLTEKLQIQQEELKATNEELEQQTQVLRASEEELRLKDDEQQRVNKKLEDRTQELEKQKSEIEEKTHRLQKTRDELKQKAEELELASKYKSEFLANMSHELRTPLNSLLILAKMFVDNEEKNLSEDQVECASIMLKSGQDLLTLINDILDLAKVEAGKIELVLANCRLTEFTEQIKRDFSHVAESKGIKLITELSGQLPETIFTDDHRVSQIIKNLISNAIKFTEHGEVTFKITRPDADINLSIYNLMPQKTVAFSVTDTGIGIPADKQSFVFESFKQADSGTSRKYGGTGLGLSISKQLSKLLGGGIELKSEEGKGSTFTLYLPEEVLNIAKETPTENQPKTIVETVPLITPTPTQITFKTTTIADDRNNIDKDDHVLLIVEDDEQFTKILMNICRKKGFKCLYSNNAESGLDLAKTYQPKGILLDIGLPGMNGLTMLDKLKNDPSTKLIPVHVISASENSIPAFKRGAVGYLTKPVDQAQLDNTLKKLEDISNTNINDLLIVEDNLPMLATMKKLLKGKDVNITGVTTGKDALVKLQNNHYDCMILDLGLPDMSGQELLLEYHKTPHDDPPAIIIHTGKSLTESESDLLTNYADSIIIKSGTASMDRLIEETNLFLHRVALNIPEKAPVVVTTTPAEPANLKDKKVLIVDDDMRNVFALSKTLKNKGFYVLMASNGKNAIETLEHNTDTDIVLMDIMMPVMDGYDAIKKIRENPNISQIPIIAVTAKAMKGDMEKCIEIGASDFLPKPINVDELLVKMKKWLS